MEEKEIIKKMKLMSDPEAVRGMAKFGINPKDTLGVSIPKLREMAKEIGESHKLALRLWESGIHEAMILATMIDDLKLVDEEQMENWVMDFDSWDVCDQCCMNLFEKTRFAYKKAKEWSSREEEFVKRAGFVLMARLAVSDKEARDEKFEELFSFIEKESIDERNFVKKAVNWALRQIGKRNLNLNKKAIEAAKVIKEMDFASAKWVASDALRELEDEKIQERLKLYGKSKVKKGGKKKSS